MNARQVSRRKLLQGFGVGLGAVAMGAVVAACGGGTAASPTTAASGSTSAAPTSAPAAAATAAPTSAPAAAAATTAPTQAAAAATAAPAAQSAPASGAAATVVVWAGSLAVTDTSTPGGQWAKWVIQTFQSKNPN